MSENSACGRPTRHHLSLETLEPRQLLSGQPMITELMARNDGGLRDGDGRSPDWIEILNAGDEALDLAGYRLTNSRDDLDLWTFPPTNLDPGQYLVVFASGEDRSDYVDSAGNLHTNFVLRRGGDYVALVSPDGTVVSQFGPEGRDFPEQLRNVSYGVAQKLSLVDADSVAHYAVPFDGRWATDWTRPGFDWAAQGFSTGNASLGYETRPTDRNNFEGQFQTELPEGIHAVYTRLEFDLRDASVVTNLLLRMKYDNGFVVYLNGVKVAEENAPPNAQWFSTAPSASLPRDSQAIQFQPFNLDPYIGQLVDGENVLAIHALNNLTDKSDMLLVPELEAGVSDMAAATGVPAKVGFMPVPTPGGPNGSTAEVFSGFVADTEFSTEHGFYREPFSLEITTDQQDVTIRYTTDGSTPTADQGLTYTGPILVNSTTTIRAVALKPDYIPSRVDTQSYVFLDDVLQQSPRGEAPPGFPSRSVGGQQLDYGMDPDIVNDPVWGPQLMDALTDIPSFSVVTDAGNLFDSRDGIYVRASSQGRDWERPASVELINPDGSQGFQINAGLRIRGGFSRTGTNPKHAFRLFFRNAYDGDLEYPLFGGEGADRFENVDLRTTQNYSWAFQGDSRNTFLRDVFSRDLQREMGQPYTRSRYYHLYINGQYWGLYQTQERSEASFAETYFGGDKDDYDVIKAEVSGGRRSVATDGNMDAFSRLHQATVAGFEDNEAYYRVQGLNPDGTRNPDYERLLDADNLIDYMIITYYTGDRDGPGSRFTGPAPNNYFGIYNRENPDGFKWFEHDSEHSMGTGDRNMVRPLVTQHSGFRASSLRNFNPHWLHEELMKNSEYALRFADRVQQYFSDDGVLSTNRAWDLVEQRAAEIDKAIIAESARWGDAQRASRPFTKTDWLRAVDGIHSFIIGRNETRAEEVIRQLRQVDFFPPIDAPRFEQHGGVIPRGFQVRLSADDGTIYYTTDGTDPRSAGGKVSATASDLTGPLRLGDNASVRARVLKDGQWSALATAEFQIQSDFPLRVTEINYHPYAANAVPGAAQPGASSDQFEFIELANIGDRTIDLGGVQLMGANARPGGQGLRFTFDSQPLSPGERILVVRDRGAFPSRYGDAVRIAAGNDGVGGADGQFGGQLSDDGQRLTLVDSQGAVVERFQYAPDGPWPGRADGRGSSLERIDASGNAVDPANWRSSRQFGGSPGAVGEPGPAILVSEVLARPDPPGGDLIEVRNITADDVNMGGWFFSDTSDDYFRYRIPPGVVVPALGYQVLSGAQLGFDLDGTGSDRLWVISADENGRPLQFEDHVQFGNSPQGVSLGRWPDGSDRFVQLAEPTLGRANSPPLVGDVVISEIHFNPADPDGDTGRLRANDFEFVELTNWTDQTVDLAEWRLAGSVQFTFSQGTSIGPGQSLAVVGFKPTDRSKPNVFRFTLGMSMSAPLAGPYSEPLDDSRGQIQLWRPDVTSAGSIRLRPLVLVDEATYDSVSPWPVGPGHSLARTQPADFGDFPTSWRSEIPSPGSAPFVSRDPGDANEDGQFDQLDIARVLQAGTYLTDQPATWGQGDWTGDGRFDQRDIVAALQARAYSQGPRALLDSDITDRIFGQIGDG